MKSKILPCLFSPSGNPSSKFFNWRYSAISSILLTVICYVCLVNADFLYYDDDVLLFNNESIKNLDLNLLASSFGFKKIMHYHPLVYLSFAVEHSLFGLNPTYYHITNILLHCLNILLLFVFLRRLNINEVVSSIVLFTFALHPLHVESVAWITERKDMLYSFFYILALISYMSYQKSGEKRFYLVSLLMFVFSCMSKSMAVTLPLVLLLIDHYFNQKAKFNFRKLTPYFIVSLVFILINLEVAYYNLDVLNYPITYRFFMVCYSVLFYPYKILFPFQLSVIYTYSEHLNYVHYLSPLLLAAIFLILRKVKNVLIRFGFLFYLITIIPVLPIVPFGISFTADRFAYLPSAGLLFAFSVIAYDWYMINVKRLPKLKVAMISLLALILIMFSVLTFNRCEKWQNSETLMNDAIAYDANNPYAYFALGNFYTANESFERAIYSYKKFLQFKPNNTNALMNLGNAYFHRNNVVEAIDCYNRLLTFDPYDKEALNNLGVVYENEGELSKAIEYYKKSASLGYEPAKKVLVYYGYE